MFRGPGRQAGRQVGTIGRQAERPCSAWMELGLQLRVVSLCHNTAWLPILLCSSSQVCKRKVPALAQGKLGSEPSWGQGPSHLRPGPVRAQGLHGSRARLAPGPVSPRALDPCGPRAPSAGQGHICAQSPLFPGHLLAQGPFGAQDLFGPRTHLGPGPIWVQDPFGPEAPGGPGPVLAQGPLGTTWQTWAHGGWIL